MPVQLSEEIRNQCRAMFYAGVLPTDIAREKAIKPDTVIKWAKRYGWDQAKKSAVQSAVRNLSGASKGANRVSIVVAPPDTLSQRSELARKAMADELEKSLGCLSSVRTGKSLEHAGTRLRALESAARVGGAVYGWGRDANSMTFGLVLLSDAQEVIEKPAVDVESVVTHTPQDKTPESPACGVEATAGGVTVIEDNTTTPQV